MPDPRYGRLFTENDVRLLMAKATVDALRRAEDRRQVKSTDEAHRVCTQLIAEADAGGELRFPADEPLFLLRGHHVMTPEVIRAYVVEAARAGASVEHREAAAAAGRYVAAWQHANADRVEVPTDG